MIRKNLANWITCLRIIGTLALIFIDADLYFFSPFIIIYILCGFTDILDGFVARLLKTDSEFGARLDTVSDLLLYIVMVFRLNIFEAFKDANLLPYLIIGLFIRVLCYLYVALKQHKLEARHSIFNKLISLMTFLFPIVKIIGKTYLNYYLLAMIIIGYIALIDGIRLIVRENIADS